MGSVDAARMAAGPNALRGSGPNRKHAFEDAMIQAGSPDPRNDRVCIESLCPRQFPVIFPAADSYAAGNNLGSLNRSPRLSRSDFVGECNGATLIGRRSMRRASQSRFVPCWRAYRMTAIAPATSVDCPASRSCRASLCLRSNAVAAPSRSMRQDCLARSLGGAGHHGDLDFDRGGRGWLVP
jgi:hypothetical protein